jgi:hypothetical protein
VLRKYAVGYGVSKSVWRHFVNKMLQAF